MATKPYRQIEETPVVANEPAVAYQAGYTSILVSVLAYILFYMNMI